MNRPTRLDLADEAVARAILELQRAAYQRRGFEVVGEREVTPGLSITELARRRAAGG